MATLTRLFDSLHGRLYRRHSDESQEPGEGMTELKSTAREIAEAKPLLLPQIVGYSGF